MKEHEWHHHFLFCRKNYMIAMNEYKIKLTNKGILWESRSHIQNRSLWLLIMGLVETSYIKRISK